MAYTPGPFSIEHWYLQWGGQLPGGEQWSCGLRMAPVQTAVSTVTQAACDAAAAAIQTFHTGVNACISPRATLAFVKLNNIDRNGHYSAPVTIQTLKANLPGGGSTVVHANQVALAISLTTGYSRGPAHRGRFYLPMPAIVIATDGMISASSAQQVSTAMDALLPALNAISTNAVVSVMSRKLGSPANRPVTGNLVGRVLDTQRRRRRSLAEDYQ